MSELRDRYDRGAVSGQITQPPFADLAGRARRRVQRHRTVRLAGVSLLAAVVSVPLLTLQGQGGGTGSGRFPDVEFPDGFLGAGSMSYTLEFYDPRHGFATYTGGSCDTSWLSVTRDGGVTWSELREVPGTSRDPLPDGSGQHDWACTPAWVVPASAETLIALVGSDTRWGYEWVDPPTSAYLSHDAGRSWQEYEPQIRSVNAMPEGVTPGQHCDDDLCEQMRVGWYDPRTGDRLVLRDNPPELNGRTGPTLAADGSIWVSGVDANEDHQVWVSRDRGRSWQERSPNQVDNAGNPDRGTTFATYDGSTAYLSAAGALYRTTDGGESWRRLQGGPPATRIADLWVASDGTLVTADGSGGHYVSGDGGESFQRTDAPGTEAEPIAGGWFSWVLDDSADDPIEGYVSDDGLSWRPIRIPRP